MYPWLQQSKMAPAGDGTSGAAGVMAVDPGAPVEIGADAPPAPVEKKEDPNESRVKALEAEIKTLRSRYDETSASERYWAERAQNGTREPAEEVIQAAAPEPEVKTTPEQDLDEIAKLGLAEVMRKRGFVSKTELNAAVKDTETRTESRITEARNDAGFDAMIATEFPEIKTAHDRIAAGKKPESPLFERAAEIYRQAVREDPSAEQRKSTFLLAIRTGKAQLDAEAALKGEKKVEPTEQDNRQQRRRERIDTQRTDRAPVGSEETDDTPSFTAQQREVMARLKVPEADFVRNSGGGRGR